MNDILQFAYVQDIHYKYILYIMAHIIYQPMDWAPFSKSRVLSCDLLHGALACLWCWGGYE